MAGSLNAIAHYEQGGAHKLAGRWPQARRSFEMALKLDPGLATARYSLGAMLLAEGRLKEGFELYEARHEIAAFRNPKPSLPFPEWRGEPLQGKRLLIWPEQGFGDQIQFARFAPWLGRSGADVTLVCSPGLRRLFKGLGADVIAATGAVSFPDPDYWVMCMSIAGRMGLALEDIPGAAYMPAGASGRRLDDRLRVGVATRGSVGHPHDHMRSLSGAEAKALFSLPARVVDLDPTSTGAKDFQDTADIIADLDLIVSVDTSVAHLAGAMGKPVWLLVPAFNTDWRWLRGRADSPWYPSMRLFRQAEPGRWGAVLDEVRDAVLTWAPAPTD